MDWGQQIGNLFSGAITWTHDEALAYIQFLKRLTLLVLLISVALFPLFIAGLVFQLPWMSALVTLLIGFSFVAVLLVGLPLGTIAVIIAERVDGVRIYLKMVGGFLLWLLLLTFYFSKLPVSNNPGAVVSVILLLLIIALFWAVYGISVNVKKIYTSVVLAFVLITLSFYLPNTFEAIEIATKGGKYTVDSMMSGCIKNLGQCITDISRPLAAMGTLEWAIVLGALWMGGSILALATNCRAISRITTRLAFIILFLLLLDWLIWGRGMGWFKGMVPAQTISSPSKNDGLWRAAKLVSPNDLVRSYFEDLNRHEVASVIEKWKEPNRAKLTSMINRVEWFRINSLELKTHGLYSAQVAIEITGKNLNEKSKDWAGTIELEKIGGEWKILTMKDLVEIK